MRYLAIHNFDYNVCVRFIFKQGQIQGWTTDEFAGLPKGSDFLGTSNHTACWIFHSTGDYAVMYCACMPPTLQRAARLGRVVCTFMGLYDLPLS